MVPVSQEFGVPMTEVAFVLTITLWLRLVGAVASGWLADRVGRKIPLMISILWYSVANFIAGFSPTFLFLAIFRALLGISMGAEWPAGHVPLVQERERGPAPLAAAECHVSSSSIVTSTASTSTPSIVRSASATRTCTSRPASGSTTP